MSDISSKTHKVANLISSLGGPTVNLGNIIWSNDLEAGNILLSWLADQLGDTDSLEIGTHGAYERGGECERSTRAAMGEVALEPAEVLMLKNIQDVPQNTYTAPPEYVPPSRLHKHVELINEEINGVHGETELLRARISQTKELSKEITHSVESLQRVLYDLDTKTHESEEGLSELSITADITVASTLDSAKEVLGSLGRSVPPEGQETWLSVDNGSLGNDGSPDLELAQHFLQDKQSEISKLIHRHQQNLEDLSQMPLEEATKTRDLRDEVRRLENVFDSLRNKGRPSKEPGTLAGSYDGVQELQQICALFEERIVSRDKDPECGGEALENLLSEVDEGHSVNRTNAVIQEGVVGDILRHAWALDQEGILSAQQKALDEALLSLDSSVAPLEMLHVSLANFSRCVQDVECLLDALAEELGSIDLYYTGNGVNKDEEDSAEIESQLKLVLDDLKDIQPINAPPLLMLSRNDILMELRALKGPSGLESSEREWVDELIEDYSRRPVHPALLKIYANSPLNTSPPFSLPFQAQQLESQFKRKATDLQGLTSALEAENRESFAKAGNTKRFEAFMDQWYGWQRA